MIVSEPVRSVLAAVRAARLEVEAEGPRVMAWSEAIAENLVGLLPGADSADVGWALIVAAQALGDPDVVDDMFIRIVTAPAHLMLLYAGESLVSAAEAAAEVARL